jgi:hypothetical protein
VREVPPTNMATIMARKSLESRTFAEFDFGTLMALALRLAQQHWLAIIICTLPFWGLQALLTWARDPLDNVLFNIVTDFTAYSLTSILALNFCFSALWAVVLTWVLTLKSLGKPLALSDFFRDILPMMFVYLITFVVTAIGFVLFIVPGLICLVYWPVALSALVAENHSPFQSMKRSADLGEGYSWPILGAIVLAAGVSVVLGFAIDGIAVAVNGGYPNADELIGMAAIVFKKLANVPIVVVSVALYIHLTRLKEKPSDEVLAKIFD